MNTATKKMTDSLEAAWRLLKKQSTLAQRNLIARAYMTSILGMTDAQVDFFSAGSQIAWALAVRKHNEIPAGISTDRFWRKSQIAGCLLTDGEFHFLTKEGGVEAVFLFMDILSEGCGHNELIRELQTTKHLAK